MPQLPALPVLLQSLALATLSGLALSALASAWGSWRRARHLAALADLELQALQVDLQAARARAEREARREGWEGLRAFRVVRKVLEDEDSRVASFYLEPHDRRPLPEFLPGQHITLSLQRSGEARPLLRCYSLSDAPGNEHLRITVKREPTGRASTFLHESIDEGDLLQLGPPAGSFHLDPQRDTPLVLIAGGVGVTPFLSMLESVAERQPQRRVWLFYGVQRASGLAQRARLEELVDPARRVVFCYSRPGQTEHALVKSSGSAAHCARRAEVNWILDEVLPPEVAGLGDFYVCGPAAMMDEVSSELLRRAVDPARIHQEAFGGKPRPDAAAAAPLSSGATYQVHLKRSDRTLTWSGAHTDLLSLLDAEGVDTVQPGCWRGSCQSCKTALISGEVAQTRPGCRLPEQGSVLPCVCIPSGDVVLDA